MRAFAHKKYQSHITCSFAHKAVCLDVKFSKPKLIVVFRGKNAAYELINAIFKEYEYCKKVIKKHFNKNLILSEKEGQKFQLSNACWILKILLIPLIIS